MGLWIGSQDGLLKEIRALHQQIAELQGKKVGESKQRDYQAEALKLREEIQTLTIERDRKQEEFDRREREVRHETGLLRKQVETETELATKEALLKVREENLSADRKRFEEQMKFTTARFEKEVEYLHKTIGKVLERLPNVTEHIALGANGKTAVKAGKADDE